MENTALYKAFLDSRSVCTDTRKLLPGDLYFALKGPNFNGNLFAAIALEAGASLAILDEAPEDPALASDHRVVVVADALKALQDLARTHRRSFQFPVFALTGSNGKTTTKELLANVLAKRYRVAATKGNLNNHIGVPLTLLSMRPDTEFAVVEMGANAQREIAGLCAIAEPDAGLITNIGDAHLEGFGGHAGVKKGKGELFDYLKAHSGTIFSWSDSSDIEDLVGDYDHVIRYGTGPKTAVNVEPITSGLYASAQLHFSSPFLSESITIHSQMVGAYNTVNLAAAACVGAHFGVNSAAIREALEAYHPSNQRSEWRSHGSNTLYLDAYNANPTSMREALYSLRDLNLETEGSGGMEGDAGAGAGAAGAAGAGAAQAAGPAAGAGKAAILGDMLELGEFSQTAHQEVADLAGGIGLRLLIFIGPEFERVRRPETSLHFENARSATEWLKNNRPSDLVILLKGSRGIGVEQTMEGLG